MGKNETLCLNKGIMKLFCEMKKGLTIHEVSTTY